MKHTHLPVRRHGPIGPSVIVLHGGPGAPGSASLLARDLANPLCVLEPWQRLSSDMPLTVAQHIKDLAVVIAHELPNEKPALVGESWGAMLALAFAAEYPKRVSALVLVGCGTFDLKARATLESTLVERTTEELREQIAQLNIRVLDENERAVHVHMLCDHLYTYARRIEDPVTRFDLKGHTESWNDMIRLQKNGTYPAAFANITCPVLMLHGAYDPHPGGLIRDGLKRVIAHLEYVEFDQCGHSPWVEAHASEHFFEILRAWLLQHLGVTGLPAAHYKQQHKSPIRLLRSLDDGQIGQGSVNTVQRQGETVIRPTGPWSPAIHGLLQYLEDVGFKYSPRFLGIDKENGKERLQYIDGDVAMRPWPDYLCVNAGVAQIGTMLRKYHDLIIGFIPPSTTIWRDPTSRWEQGMIVRHGDLGPWNMVWKSGHLVGLIDWDHAEPGFPIDDVAQAAWYCIPLRTNQKCLEAGIDICDIQERMICFCDSYGITLQEVVAALVKLQRREITRTHQLGLKGIEPWVTYRKRGDIEEIYEEMKWLHAMVAGAKISAAV